MNKNKIIETIQSERNKRIPQRDTCSGKSSFFTDEFIDIETGPFRPSMFCTVYVSRLKGFSVSIGRLGEFMGIESDRELLASSIVKFPVPARRRHPKRLYHDSSTAFGAEKYLSHRWYISFGKIQNLASLNLTTSIFLYPNNYTTQHPP